jgi:hypothetical protein
LLLAADDVLVDESVDLSSVLLQRCASLPDFSELRLALRLECGELGDLLLFEGLEATADGGLAVFDAAIDFLQNSLRLLDFFLRVLAQIAKLGCEVE